MREKLAPGGRANATGKSPKLCAFQNRTEVLGCALNFPYLVPIVQDDKNAVLNEQGRDPVNEHGPQLAVLPPLAHA